MRRKLSLCCSALLTTSFLTSSPATAAPGKDDWRIILRLPYAGYAVGSLRGVFDAAFFAAPNRVLAYAGLSSTPNTFSIAPTDSAWLNGLIRLLLALVILEAAIIGGSFYTGFCGPTIIQYCPRSW